MLSVCIYIVAAVTVLDRAGMSCMNHHDKASTVNASFEAVTQTLTLRCAYRRSEQNLRTIRLCYF